MEKYRLPSTILESLKTRSFWCHNLVIILMVELSHFFQVKIPQQFTLNDNCRICFQHFPSLCRKFILPRDANVQMKIKSFRLWNSFHISCWSGNKEIFPTLNFPEIPRDKPHSGETKKTNRTSKIKINNSRHNLQWTLYWIYFSRRFIAIIFKDANATRIQMLSNLS